MDSTILFVVSSLLALSLPLQVEPAKATNPQITVMGVVYCDICSNNTFSRHSYFLAGAEVRIDCMFKAISPRTTEQISFSVNRTTNKYGVYKLEIPSVDGIECAREKAMESSCRASLMWSSSSSCNVPGFRTTSDEIAVKSEQANLCIYSLSALNYRPSKRDITLCEN
uniref:Pollen Ole e 1 allergen and extensin family protein n=2 Tax=Davidia involucrata TaxID=16924 RepID=A0A5B7B391_DAVIN